jgi:hypothetical protein
MKTTKQDFEKFKTFVYEWQRELGLDDWHIYIFHKPIRDSYADTNTSIPGRRATIRFSMTWTDRPTSDTELKASALHEVLHIVTAPLWNEARARFADEYTMDAAEHSIVTRLTNYITRIK